MINKLAENLPAYGIVFGALSMAIYPLFDTSLTKVISPHFEGIILGFAVAAILVFVGFERMKIISAYKDLTELKRKNTEVEEENDLLKNKLKK